MRQRAEHPADGVAELAVGIHIGLEDFRADPQVLGVIGRDYPQPQDVRARLAITSCGVTVLPSDFDILRPSSSMTKPMGQYGVIRRAPARAAAFEQRRMEPAAMLVGAFQIEVGGPLSGRAAPSSTKAWVEPESNQTSRMSSTFSQSAAG
jgi:hypothetical protein